jgi:DMSO/TMAO reductase YedYZ heme-binding membrane subunit
MLAFFLIFQPWISKHPSIFYGITIAFILLLFASYFTGLYESFPAWFSDSVVMMFARGALSTAVFAIVMYLGVIPVRFAPAGRLMRIRAEMSIIGCILALGHNVYYGMYYFYDLFTKASELELPYLIATVITLILIAIMLPLMITSFRSVRKKMSAPSWKKLQRLAYVFYVLLYIHVMIVLCANVRGISSILSIAAYTLVFVPYFVLRLRKNVLQRNARTLRLAT